MTDDIDKLLDELMTDLLWQCSDIRTDTLEESKLLPNYVEIKQSLHQLIQSEYKRGWEDAMKQENPPDRINSLERTSEIKSIVKEWKPVLDKLRGE